MIYTYLYVSNSASVFLFPVPPDFDFHYGCLLGRLSDCSQSSELEYCIGQSKRTIWTKPETSKEEEWIPPALKSPSKHLKKVCSDGKVGVLNVFFLVSSEKTRLLIIQFHRYRLKLFSLVQYYMF